MAPQDTKTNETKLVPSTTAHGLKAAIFHIMAFELSLEINNDQILQNAHQILQNTPSTKRSFLKVLYNVCKIENKNIPFEQYARLHLDGPKIAICETASKAVFVLNSSFTTTLQWGKRQGLPKLGKCWAKTRESMGDFCCS